MEYIKKIIKKIPVLREVTIALKKLRSNRKFPGTETYWEERYKSGGNSGSGSYNRLAEFKAKVINDFIKKEGIISSIEFGCGDGNNLSLINYPKYIGLDVSPTAIKLCINKFNYDNTKSFYVYNSLSFRDNHKLFSSELTLSLDVIFHLVEDDIFIKYMTDLFFASQKYVIIYSRDYSETQVSYERSRNFSKWIKENQTAFKLIERIENPYKYDPTDPDNTSNALFMIYKRQKGGE